MRSFFLAAALSLISPHASMKPTTITCQSDWPYSMYWGRMKVTFDEQARHVHVEADDDTAPGAKENYWDGAFASMYTGKIYWWMDEDIVEQFVRFTPTKVEVGWHDLNGELKHYASFDRSAFHNKWTGCRWRVFWLLGQG